MTVETDKVLALPDPSFTQAGGLDVDDDNDNDDYHHYHLFYCDHDSCDDDVWCVRQ